MTSKKVESQITSIYQGEVKLFEISEAPSEEEKVFISYTDNEFFQHLADKLKSPITVKISEAITYTPEPTS